MFIILKASDFEVQNFQVTRMPKRTANVDVTTIAYF